MKLYDVFNVYHYLFILFSNWKHVKKVHYHNSSLNKIYQHFMNFVWLYQVEATTYK